MLGQALKSHWSPVVPLLRVLERKAPEKREKKQKKATEKWVSGVFKTFELSWLFTFERHLNFSATGAAHIWSHMSNDITFQVSIATETSGYLAVY